MTDPTGGFFTGGAKSLSWGNMGDNTWLNKWRGGKITNIREATQQTDWKTKAPVCDAAGRPKMQLPLEFECVGGGELVRAAYSSSAEVQQAFAQGGPIDERTDPKDDGRRTDYIKGTKRMAVMDKMRELGLKSPEIGGEIYFRFTGTQQTPSGPGRVWEVLYLAPSGAAQAGSFFEPEQQAPPAAPPAAPQPVTFAPQAQPPAAAPSAPPAGASPWGSAPAAQQPAQAPAPSPWG